MVLFLVLFGLILIDSEIAEFSLKMRRRKTFEKLKG